MSGYPGEGEYSDDDTMNSHFYDHEAHREWHEGTTAMNKKTVVVPVEPTDAMIEAFVDAGSNSRFYWNRPNAFGSSFAESYRRMIAAAPAATAKEQHYDDYAVDCFAQMMKEKLRHSREVKGRGGWNDPSQCSVEYLQKLFHEHVQKGDPVDVANLCMMLAHYRATTTPSFDVWQANPYTQVLQKSIAEDYVPKTAATAQPDEREGDLTTKEAWWAGYRAGKGLPPDTPRKDALAAPQDAQERDDLPGLKVCIVRNPGASPFIKRPGKDTAAFIRELYQHNPHGEITLLKSWSDSVGCQWAEDGREYLERLDDGLPIPPTAQPSDKPEDQFCDGHCTWRDHHPDCIRADKPEGKADQNWMRTVRHKLDQGTPLNYGESLQLQDLLLSLEGKAEQHPCKDGCIEAKRVGDPQYGCGFDCQIEPFPKVEPQEQPVAWLNTKYRTLHHANAIDTCTDVSELAPLYAHPPAQQQLTDEDCGDCHKCLEGKTTGDGFFLLTSTRMILCPTCGNKRCPKANDHRNACTGSNEPGQPGSAYPSPLSRQGGEDKKGEAA